MKRRYHYDMPAVAPKVASEEIIQASCRLRIEAEFDCIWIAIPNGAKRGFRAQARIRREGVRAGAPDAVIVGGVRNPGKVAFVEMKARSALSDEQAILLADMARAGHDVGVFRSQDTLAEWMRIRGWV